MITQEQIKRINELSRKSKAEGLTESEKKEQAKLRELYVSSFKENLVAQLNNTYIVDEKGNKRKLKRKEMSKLIVIEGLDGSGKSTQLELLISALEKDGKRVRKIKLPDYESPSSTLVKMYLGGEFGKDPNAVNAYAAGAFYAVDRYASFTLDWKTDYESDKIIVADRYATSNSIYQTEKLLRQIGIPTWIGAQILSIISSVFRSPTR